MATKATTKTFDTGKANFFNGHRLFIEQIHNGTERVSNRPVFVFVIVVIAKHAKDRYVAIPELFSQHLRFFGLAVLRKVAANNEHISVVSNFLKLFLVAANIVLAKMNITDSGNSNSGFFFFTHTIKPPSLMTWA